MALKEDTTLQAIFNKALENYLNQEDKKEAKKIVFKTHNLGVALDNLTRDDYYDEQGKSLSVWFDDPKKEVVSEEAGEGIILNKDKKGNVIGFEKLYTDLPKYKGKIQLPVEISPVSLKAA